LVQRSEDVELVAAAVRALSQTSHPAARETVVPLLAASHPLVAVSAVEALARLMPGHESDALLAGLAHPDAEVVKASLVALAEAGHPALLKHLASCLEHASWDVRRLAVDLVGRVAGDAGQALLAERLEREESAPVQEALLRVLGRRDTTPVPRKSREPR
jgi:HEAT repeat protein